MVIKKGSRIEGSTRSDAFTRRGTWGMMQRGESNEGGGEKGEEEAWGRHNSMGCGTLI